MLVRDAMATDVTMVAPDTTIDTAVQTMADLDVGALLIGEEGGKPEGIITGRDILVRVVAPRRDPRVTAVREVMSLHLFCCNDEDDCEAVLLEMERRQVRRAPVIDRQGRLVGMITPEETEQARTARTAADKPQQA